MCGGVEKVKHLGDGKRLIKKREKLYLLNAKEVQKFLLHVVVVVRKLHVIPTPRICILLLLYNVAIECERVKISDNRAS